MVCSKCGRNNPDTAKFCEECGTALKSAGAVGTIRLKCKNCDGIMTADEKNHVLICPFCGSRELIVDSEAVALEKVRAANEREREIRQAEEKAARSFEKSIFRRVLFIFTILSLLFSLAAFFEHCTISGVIGLFQAALNLLAWMTGMRVIRTSRRHLPRTLFLLGLLLSIPYLIFFGESRNSYVRHHTDFSWDDSRLTELIERPDTENISIHTASDELFSMDAYDVAASDYKNYLSSCISRGFTQDSSKDSYGYTAFNADGAKLELGYYEYAKEMSLRLSAPLELTGLNWPSSGIASLLPVPASSTGLLDWESPRGISLYVGETSRDRFASYVQACIDSGFDVDYSRDSDSFYGNDSDGNRLSVYYYGFDIMEINLHAPND